MFTNFFKNYFLIIFTFLSIFLISLFFNSFIADAENTQQSNCQSYTFRPTDSNPTEFCGIEAKKLLSMSQRLEGIRTACDAGGINSISECVNDLNTIFSELAIPNLDYKECGTGISASNCAKENLAEIRALFGEVKNDVTRGALLIPEDLVQNEPLVLDFKPAGSAGNSEDCISILSSGGCFPLNVFERLQNEINSAVAPCFANSTDAKIIECVNKSPESVSLTPAFTAEVASLTCSGAYSDIQSLKSCLEDNNNKLEQLSQDTNNNYNLINTNPAPSQAVSPYVGLGFDASQGCMTLNGQCISLVESEQVQDIALDLNTCIESLQNISDIQDCASNAINDLTNNISQLDAENIACLEEIDSGNISAIQSCVNANTQELQNLLSQVQNFVNNPNNNVANPNNYTPPTITGDPNLGATELASSIMQNGVEPLDGYGDVGSFYGSIVNIVFFLGVSLALIFIIVCGIKYMTSGGNPQELETAKSCIKGSVIGIVLVVGFRVILTLVIRAITGGSDSLGGSNFFGP